MQSDGDGGQPSAPVRRRRLPQLLLPLLNVRCRLAWLQAALALPAWPLFKHPQHKFELPALIASIAASPFGLLPPQQGPAPAAGDGAAGSSPPAPSAEPACPTADPATLPGHTRNLMQQTVDLLLGTLSLLAVLIACPLGLLFHAGLSLAAGATALLGGALVSLKGTALALLGQVDLWHPLLDALDPFVAGAAGAASAAFSYFASRSRRRDQDGADGIDPTAGTGSGSGSGGVPPLAPQA